MFKNAKVGDKVWSFVSGWGTIIRINEDENYPLMVSFNLEEDSYTYEGYYRHNNINPTLFWDEVTFTIPSKPLPKLVKDQPLIVWGSDSSGRRFHMHFSHFENGHLYTFANGYTSWSTDGGIAPWPNYEIPTQTDE